MSSDSTFAIHLTLEQVGVSEFYMYPRVYYDPMNCAEGRQCLKNFYCSVCDILQQLHDILKLVHLDIRLENICFNQSYQPVFIDMDRAMNVGAVKLPYTASRSCMYVKGRNAGRMDWVQLGWLIAWVVDDKHMEYHARSFETLSSTLQGSETLETLILQGIVQT